jgi:hypothetical protein
MDICTVGDIFASRNNRMCLFFTVYQIRDISYEITSFSWTKIQVLFWLFSKLQEIVKTKNLIELVLLNNSNFDSTSQIQQPV